MRKVCPLALLKHDTYTRQHKQKLEGNNKVITPDLMSCFINTLLTSANKCISKQNIIKNREQTNK